MSKLKQIVKQDSGIQGFEGSSEIKFKKLIPPLESFEIFLFTLFPPSEDHANESHHLCDSYHQKRQVL